MNNFFGVYPTQKPTSQKVLLQPAFVLRRSGRIVVPATATFMPETEYPYKSKTGGAGCVWPIKRNGEKYCRITSSRAGGINGPPLLS